MNSTLDCLNFYQKSHINRRIVERRIWMDHLSREEVINALQEPFQSYLEQYGMEDIGIFEEDGQDDIYHMGYTVKKDGKTYHIHTSFRKNNEQELAPLNNLWTVESDDPHKEDHTGYRDLESAFRNI
jgi:hypothetical protein